MNAAVRVIVQPCAWLPKEVRQKRQTLAGGGSSSKAAEEILKKLGLVNLRSVRKELKCKLHEIRNIFRSCLKRKRERGEIVLESTQPKETIFK